MVKPGNVKLTVSVNKRAIDQFKKLCEEEGWKLGKQIEKYFISVLENR
ncbi:MAG: hypothetical protein V3V78_00100 [Candidatus Woesearchaeota archaeon]